MDAHTQMLLGYHLLLNRAGSSLGGISGGTVTTPLPPLGTTPGQNELATQINAFHLLKHNPYLQQYHLAALAPFLTSQAQAAVSPRRDAEEELALLALQAMKHPSPGGDRRGTTKSGVTRVTGPPSSSPSSDISDHAHVPSAAFANRGSPSRAYVKRHEFWRHKTATRPTTRGGAPGSGRSSDEDCDSLRASGGEGVVQVANRVLQVAGEHVARVPVPAKNPPSRQKPVPAERGFYDTSDARDGNPPGVKDELAKEWAAMTTWIRMNLHRPRTARRKVLFVGHHHTLHPVLGGGEGTGDEGDEPKEGSTLASHPEAVGGKRKIASVGGQEEPASVPPVPPPLRGRKREEDDFVFVLNPDLDWSDVGHDTRVRMKTLVAECADIFTRKYKKRAPWEWERKIQKYRPPGTNKTFNVPMGCVVRGIQEAYFIWNPEERPVEGQKEK